MQIQSSNCVDNLIEENKDADLDLIFEDKVPERKISESSLSMFF